jgi:hypothetical protein
MEVSPDRVAGLSTGDRLCSYHTTTLTLLGGSRVEADRAASEVMSVIDSIRQAGANSLREIAAAGRGGMDGNVGEAGDRPQRYGVSATTSTRMSKAGNGCKEQA